MGPRAGLDGPTELLGPQSKESHLKSDRQCAYNVTLRRVRTTGVAVGKECVLHNLSVCS
jgi:hypothetical protein